MAAAGFIPVVGWAGRAAKGGSAIYKTVKAYNAADHALDAYKTSKSFSTLQKTEMGIYGLVSANGLGEAVLGKDMFGNELTSEQRQNSMLQALGIIGLGGAGYYVDRLQAKNAVFPMPPYSNQYVNKKIVKAKTELSDIGRRIGDLPVPVRVKSEAYSTNMGLNFNFPYVEHKSLRELIIQAKTLKSVNHESIRGYRQRDLTDYPRKYLVDSRLIVEMNFKGKGLSGTNAAGWERNAKKFFNELLKRIQNIGARKIFLQLKEAECLSWMKILLNIFHNIKTI